MRWWKKSVILAFVSVIGAFIDLWLSHIAYLREPAYFIEHEANREIVPFFTDGALPLLYIGITLMVAIIAFPMIRSFDEMKEKHPKYNIQYKHLFYSFLSLYLLTCFSHVCGGLTWFDDGVTTNIFINFFELSSFIIGGYISAIFIGLMIITRRDEKKENEFDKNG